MESRRIDAPVPGFFRMRLVSKGPWVPARIARPCQCTVNGGDAQREHDWRDTCDRYPQMVASINGREVASVDRVWLHGRPIPESEYRFLMADLEHARQWRPDDAKSDPTRAIDLGAMKPLF